MNTYAVTYGEHTERTIGATAGKAKYQFFLDHEYGDLMTFGDFLKSVECRLVHKFHPRDLFGDIEQFYRVKEYRDIGFAFMGMRVEVDGRPGTIVGANSSANLDVCFDGESWRSNCHPWWRVKYFDNFGNIVREYRD